MFVCYESTRGGVKFGVAHKEKKKIERNVHYREEEEDREREEAEEEEEEEER